MNKENLLTVFLAVLVVVSAIQAIQLVSLGSALSTGAVVSKPAPSSASSGSGTGHVTNLPSNLDDLSGMVGGC